LKLTYTAVQVEGIQPVGEEGTNLFDDINIIAEEDIMRTVDRPFSAPEQLYAEVALRIGVDTGALTKQEYFIAHQ